MIHRFSFVFYCIVALIAQPTSSFCNLQYGEYFINDDPGEGSGTALDAKDGAFDSLYEEVNTNLPIANLKGGVHRVGIRFKDNKGNWSLPSMNYLKVYDFGAPDDTEPPTIQLLGEKIITIKKGDLFDDP